MNPKTFDPFSAAKLNDDGTPVISEKVGLNQDSFDQAQASKNIFEIKNEAANHNPPENESQKNKGSKQIVYSPQSEGKSNTEKDEPKAFFTLKEIQMENLDDFKPFGQTTEKDDSHVSIVFDDLIRPEYPELSRYENPIPEPTNFVPFEKAIAADILSKFCEDNFGYKPSFNV